MTIIIHTIILLGWEWREFKWTILYRMFFRTQQTSCSPNLSKWYVTGLDFHRCLGMWEMRRVWMPCGVVLTRFELCDHERKKRRKEKRKRKRKRDRGSNKTWTRKRETKYPNKDRWVHLLRGSGLEFSWVMRILGSTCCLPHAQALISYN